MSVQAISNYFEIFLDAVKMASALPVSGGVIAVTELYAQERVKWIIATVVIFLGINASLIANYYIGQLFFSLLKAFMKPKQIKKAEVNQGKITAGIVATSLSLAIFNNANTSQVITLGGMLNAKKRVIFIVNMALAVILTAYVAMATVL